MKRKIFGFLCLLILSAPLFADMSKEELQRMYLDYLQSRNIQAHIDSDGDIEFQYTGEYINDLTFWIYVDEKDQRFFQIYTTGIYRLNTNAERLRASFAAADASMRAAVAKINIWNDETNVTASAGTFLVNPQDFRNVFVKLMREIDFVILCFLDGMEDE